MELREGNMKQKMISGLAWNGAERVLAVLFSLVSYIVLLRFLEVEHFALYNMLVPLSLVASSIVDSGFSQALIQKQNTTAKEYNSVFILNISISVVLYVGLVALSGAIANFYDQRYLTKLIPFLFANILINSFSFVQTTIYTKRMDFATLSKASVFATLVGSGGAILAAFLGAGVWALLIQSVLSHLLKVIILWIRSDWRPKMQFSVKAIKGLFGFGSQLFLTGFINSMFNNGVNMLLGKTYGSKQFGFMTQAIKLNTTTAGAIGLALQNVTFPAFSTMQNNDERLRSVLDKLISMISLVIFPAILGLILVLEDTMFVIAGEKWMPAVKYMKVALLAAPFVCYVNVTQNILKAKGRGKLLLLIEILKKGVGAALLTFGAMHSAKMFFCCFVGWMAFEMVVNVAFVKKEVGYKIGDFIKSVAQYLVYAVVMYVVVLCVDNIMQDKISLILKIVVKIVVGAGCYWAICAITKPKAYREAVGIVRNILLKR